MALVVSGDEIHDWSCDHNIVTLFQCDLIYSYFIIHLFILNLFLELEEDCSDDDDIIEIMSNVHLNTNFLNLARDVRSPHPTVSKQLVNY